MIHYKFGQIITNNRSCKTSKSSSDSKRRSVKSKKRLSNRKFVPPRQLSKKEIREEFDLQNRLLLERSNNDSHHMNRYLDQLLNRPSVEQIQNSTHLALIRKTKEGVEVIPAEPKCKRPRSTLLKRFHSKEEIHVDMFSDKNAEHFQEYLNSNEKNFNTFNMSFGKKSVEMQNKSFKFQPGQVKVDGYTEGSTITSFSRRASEENNLLSSQRSSYSLIKGQSSRKLQHDAVNESLTPDGYYKRNKSDIVSLVDKYLNTSSQMHVQEQHSHYDVSACVNIFENNYPSNDDLSL